MMIMIMIQLSTSLSADFPAPIESYISFFSPCLLPSHL